MIKSLQTKTVLIVLIVVNISFKFWIENSLERFALALSLTRFYIPVITLFTPVMIYSEISLKDTWSQGKSETIHNLAH